MSGIPEAPTLEDARNVNLFTGTENENQKKIKLCECGCGQPTGIITRSAPSTGHVKGGYYRFCLGHGTRIKNHWGEPNKNLPLNFMVKIYGECGSLRNTGKALNVHAGTVKRFLYRNGIYIQTLREGLIGKRRGEYDRAIPLLLAIKLYYEGDSIRSAARVLRIHHSTLLIRLRRNGFSIKPLKFYALNVSGYIRNTSTGVAQHREIAERVLGRKLKRNEVVHHMDGNKSNNVNNNLVICLSGYHSWLHKQLRERKRKSNEKRT